MSTSHVEPTVAQLNTSIPQVGSVSSERLSWLDELRGLAAALVIVGHSRLLLESGSHWAILDVFPRGVQLFYILSGFILFQLYGHKVWSASTYRSFLIKRFFRIAPMFYLVLVVCFICFFQNISSPIWNFLSHLLIFPMGFSSEFINGIIGVEWSIFVECSFYVLFPLLAIAYRKAPMTFVATTLVISLLQCAWMVVGGSSVAMRTYSYNLPTTQLVFFVMGMHLAASSYMKPARGTGGMAVVALVGFFLMPYVAGNFSAQVYASLLAFSGLVFIYPAIPRPSHLVRVMNWLGERSYSLYLVHLPLYVGLKPLLALMPSFAGLLLFSAVLLAISELTYRFVERPGVRLGTRLVASVAVEQPIQKGKAA